MGLLLLIPSSLGASPPPGRVPVAGGRPLPGRSPLTASPTETFTATSLPPAFFATSEPGQPAQWEMALAAGVRSLRCEQRPAPRRCPRNARLRDSKDETKRRTGQPCWASLSERKPHGKPSDVPPVAVPLARSNAGIRLAAPEAQKRPSGGPTCPPDDLARHRLPQTGILGSARPCVRHLRRNSAPAFVRRLVRFRKPPLLEPVQHLAPPQRVPLADLAPQGLERGTLLVQLRLQFRVVLPVSRFATVNATARVLLDASGVPTQRPSAPEQHSHPRRKRFPLHFHCVLPRWPAFAPRTNLGNFTPRRPIPARNLPGPRTRNRSASYKGMGLQWLVQPDGPCGHSTHGVKQHALTRTIACCP